jgi:cytochrome c oxidase subunit 4
MSEGHPNEGRPPVGELFRGPAAVWLCLVVLWGISCAGAFAPLGGRNLILHLALAALMIGAVAIFLMNLGRADALVRLFAVAELFWVIFLFVLTFTEYLTRHYSRSTRRDQAAVGNRSIQHGRHPVECRAADARTGNPQAAR